MKRFELYRMKNEVTTLSEEYFNPIWFDIDSRIDALESVKISWEEAVRTISQYGITRIEELIRPAWQHLQRKKTEADEIVEEIRELRETADAIINAERDEVVQAIIQAKNESLSSIATVRAEALNQINNLYANAVADITTAKTDALNSIEQARQQAISQLDLTKIYAMTFFFGGE